MIIPIVDQYVFTVTLILTALVGLCVGSFLNVVVYRLPNGMSLANPPSHCPKCDYRLKWYDNVPVLSYVFLGGKCRNCRQPITPRYMIVELSNALLWVACLLLFRQNAVYALISAIICSVSICVFFIDLENMYIPDRFQIILGVLGIASIFFDTTSLWYDHLIGGVAGFAVFYLVDLVMSARLGKDALGGGDIKLALVSGLILGWGKLILMMLIASVSGSVFMLIEKRKNGESKESPFAPYLSSGLVISLLFGDIIINWYFGLLSAL